ncbi:MAG TPA: methyl-accepting chemotaxis protein [Myxococcales bacterium]|jgi:methyl-accepting chemotaxis protein
MRSPRRAHQRILSVLCLSAGLGLLWPWAAEAQPRCRWGDPPTLPGQPAFDEAAFLESLSPCAFMEEPPGRDDSSLLWMAIPVPAPKVPVRDPALLLAQVSGGALEIWFEGKRPYASGTVVPDGWGKPAHQEGHLFRIPPEAVGKNLLLRLQSSQTIGVEGPKLGEYGDLLKDMTERGLPKVAFAAVAIVLGLAALLYGAARRQRLFLYFACTALAIGLFVGFEENLVAAVFGSQRSAYFAVLLSVFALPPSLVGFVSASISTVQRPWLAKVLKAELIGAGLCWLGILVGLPWVKLLVVFAPLAVGGVATIVLVSVLEILRGNREVWVFLVGVGIFAGSLLLEGLGGVVGGINIGWSILGAAAALSANVAIVARRYLGLVQVTEKQAQELKAREGDVRKFVGDLAGWAQRLGEAVTGLSRAAQTQAEALRNQGQALVEAQSTTSEIGQASSVAKTRAGAVLGGAARAEAAGKVSDEAIAQTFSGLDSVKAAVGATAHQAARLGEHSQELVGVAHAVKDLAAQSRLMALNAGLEAARAGEQGRGFAVVAGEMRRLAEASASSADKVAKALREIHGAVTEMVRLADGGAREVQEVIGRIRQSGEQLREVASIAASAGTDAREIATAVSQQDTGVQQVLGALRVLNDQTAGTAEAQAVADQAATRVQEVVAGLLSAAEAARKRL